MNIFFLLAGDIRSAIRRHASREKNVMSTAAIGGNLQQTLAKLYRLSSGKVAQQNYKNDTIVFNCTD